MTLAAAQRAHMRIGVGFCAGTAALSTAEPPTGAVASPSTAPTT